VRHQRGESIAKFFPHYDSDIYIAYQVVKMASNTSFSPADREAIFTHIVTVLLRQVKSTRFYTTLFDLYSNKDPTALVVLTNDQIASFTYKNKDNSPGDPFSDDHCNLQRVF